MRNMFYVDMHCHAAAKPYSWSFDTKTRPAYECRNKNTSIWYNDPPTKRDKKLNEILHISKFTQSDFRTLRKGDVKVISACLSPIERDFIITGWPGKEIVLCLVEYIKEFSEEFINHVIKEDRDYFEDLENEYAFYDSQQAKQCNGNFPTLFQLTNNYDEISGNLKGPGKDIIYIFFSIEGCHVFNNAGLAKNLKYREDGVVLKDNVKKVKKRINKVKRWKYPPLYVSIAHHINNDLCGHVKSLPSFIGRIINQKDGINTGFTELGLIVLKKLLKKTPRRIYIDIKHMSAASRTQYYEELEKISKGECIPVLASHGAVNGRPSVKNWEDKKENETQEKINYEDEDRYHNDNNIKFNNDDANFFDDEIIRMEATGGFLGIQIDERRLCSRYQKRRDSRKKTRGQQLFHQAGLIWKQIRYIAKRLDENKRFGWGTAAIGSDYDGLVDPPNGYWTSEDFGILEENLIHHATEYFEKHANNELKKRVENKNPADYLAKAHAKALTHALVEAKTRVAAHISSSTHANVLGVDHARDLEHDLNEAKTHANALAQAKALEKALAEEHSQAKAYELDQEQDENKIKELTQEQIQADEQTQIHNQIQAQAQALSNALALAQDQVKAHAQAHSLELGQAETLATALDQALEEGQDKIFAFTQAQNTNKRQNRVKAKANAQVVIDLFMRGNALLFLKNFYRVDVRIVRNQLNEVLCPESQAKK